MELLIRTTFLIISIFSMINFLVYMFLYQQAKKKLYLMLSLFWMTLIINFVIQAIFQNTIFEIVLAYSFALIPLNLLCISSCALIGRAYPIKLFAFVSAISIFSSVIILQLDGTFFWSALPVAISTFAPLAYAGYKFISIKGYRASKLTNFCGVIFFLQAIHCVNFAVFRMDPDAQLWGWPVAYGFYQLLAGVIPALTMQIFHAEEKKRLDTIIETKTKDLKHANKNLKQIATEKNFLFCTLTHDISNPLLILKYSFWKLEKQKYDINSFYKKSYPIVERIESLLNQVKVLDNLKSGSTSLNIKENKINDLLTLSLISLENKISDKNIKIKYNMDELNSTYLMVERDTFVNSVLQNILSNSIKFSHPGGQISITCKTQNDLAFLIIRDEGIGIPKDILENIFKFDKNTSRKGTAGENGTGFGMPILKHLIELYGGEIKINSKPEDEQMAGFTEYKIVLHGYSEQAVTKAS